MCVCVFLQVRQFVTKPVSVAHRCDLQGHFIGQKRGEEGGGREKIETISEVKEREEEKYVNMPLNFILIMCFQGFLLLFLFCLDKSIVLIDTTVVSLL